MFIGKEVPGGENETMMQTFFAGWQLLKLVRGRCDAAIINFKGVTEMDLAEKVE